MTKKNSKKIKTPKVDIPIVNIKNSESEEERISWGSGKSNQFSDELKSDNQQILEDAKDDIIMSDSTCFSDIQYCQTFSTPLLWVDHWTAGIIFFIFQGFWLIPLDSLITRMFPVKFSKFLCRFQKLSSKIPRKFANILFYYSFDFTIISWDFGAELLKSA